MFAVSQRGSGDINNDLQERSNLQERSRNINLFPRSSRPLVIDLVAFDTNGGKIYVLPDIDVNAFYRDALNAVLEDTLQLE